MSERAVTQRGTTNANVRGSVYDRAARRAWLITTYRADVDLNGQPACRCYKCGELLTETTLTVDRIIPGEKGGTYRRNNIRPACGPCNFGHNRSKGRWKDEAAEAEPPDDASDEPWVAPWEKAWS